MAVPASPGILTLVRTHKAVLTSVRTWPVGRRSDNPMPPPPVETPVAARRGLLLAAAAYGCWSLLSPGNAILLREFDPMWLQAIRGVLAAAVLAPLLRLGDWRVVASFSGRPDVLLLAVAGNGVSFTFFVLAQTRIPATFTTLGFYTAPVWTALLAWMVLREPVGRTFGVTVAALLVGGWLALGRPGVDGGSIDALGMMLAVGSGVAWAVYSVLLRKHETLPFLPLLWFSLAVGAAWFLLGALAFEPLPAWSAVSGGGWLWTGIQVAVPTLAALGLFQASLRHAPAARVNVLVGIELGGTALVSWLLLGHALDAVQGAGLTLVLLAVSAYLWLRARPEPSPSPTPAPP